MKRERLLLTVLGAIFFVELAIAAPAVWSQYVSDRDGASSIPVVANASPQPRASASATTSPPAASPPSAPPPSASPLAAPAAVASRAATTRSLVRAGAGEPLLLAVRATDPPATPVKTAGEKTASLANRKQPERVAVVDDMPQENASETFAYSGHWEHVRAIEDGRTAGTSSRSYRAGSLATLTFTGTEVRLFGVCGPSGGRAVVTLDGHPAAALANFHAATKEAHMLVFSSPRLHRARHILSIAVVPDARATKARYVNIDGAEFE